MQRIKLGDVLDVKRGASLSGEYYAEEGQYVRLTLGNFNYPGGGFKENTFKNDIYFVGPIKPEFILKKGDIITPLTEQVSGLLGETATIPESDKYIQSGDVGLVIPDETRLNRRFAYYLIASPIVKKQLDAAAQQTKIRHTSPDAIKACEAWIPEDIAVQEDIGKLLDNINEKIRSNNAICTELEAMAKLLYDYWFVQFDFPNENGKPYKSSGGKMVWNEDLKREIPEGWEVKSLNQLCSVVSGYPFNSDTYDDNGKYHVLTIKNIQDGYIATSTDSNVCCIPSDIPKCDILQSGDILMSLTGNVGRVGILCGDNYLLNQRASIILPKEESIKWFLYSLFRNESIFIQIQRVATGTSQKNVSPTDIGNIVVPYRKGIADNYNKAIGNSIQKMIVCNMENQQLASLRDFLLPMLMNGQVKVSG